MRPVGQYAATDAGEAAAADDTMKAVVQDSYGSADVLRLAQIDPRSVTMRCSSASALCPCMSVTGS
jgi:hypothetical protein